jgi:hypothetical protein
MASLGVKSFTMVQEMVITLSFRPPFVVTSTTGPHSSSVNALPMRSDLIPFPSNPASPQLALHRREAGQSIVRRAIQTIKV